MRPSPCHLASLRCLIPSHQLQHESIEGVAVIRRGPVSLTAVITRHITIIKRCVPSRSSATRLEPSPLELAPFSRDLGGMVTCCPRPAHVLVGLSADERGGCPIRVPAASRRSGLGARPVKNKSAARPRVSRRAVLAGTPHAAPRTTVRWQRGDKEGATPPGLTAALYAPDDPCRTSAPRIMVQRW